MLVARCLVCEDEVLRAKLVGYQHAPRLRQHLATHDAGVNTFSSRDVLESFRIERIADEADADADAE